MADIIEISSTDLDDQFQVNQDSKKIKSSNFGGGIELLMNDKIKDNGGSSRSNEIDLEDLNDLENELNNLVDDDVQNSFQTSSSYQSKSNMFGFTNDENKTGVRFQDDPNEGISIGQSTAQTQESSKTWDGYGKFNNVPINPDKELNPQPQLTKEELLREKFKFLRKLETLEKKGVELSKKYSMESPLAEMQGEYETIMEEKMKQNSVKFQGNMLMAVINGIEFLNNKFDPFDIKLDGWSDQINENITDYDDIFAELFEKYKSKASMAPELKLLFQLGGSAMMVHMTNTMFKSAMPGMDDILRQNPDLMRSFQNAAVNSMAPTNPGFSGFMSNLMNPEPSVVQGRGPPPPLATQGSNSIPPPNVRPGNNNFAVNMNRNMGQSNFVDDGIQFRETSRRQPASSSLRPEMKGPSDLSDILSGLKTKTINIQQQQQQQQQQSQYQNSQMPNNNDSTISISDLKELQGEVNFPKKSKRKQRSASNTISLDI
jgi:hypothetical protein